MPGKATEEKRAMREAEKLALKSKAAQEKKRKEAAKLATQQTIRGLIRARDDAWRRGDHVKANELNGEIYRLESVE